MSLLRSEEQEETIRSRLRHSPALRIDRYCGMSYGLFLGPRASMAPEGVFLKSSTHPRAYGNFARLLGKYVHEEKVISLTEAVRRLTGLPATNLGHDRRGFLKIGMFADVVVFNPATIADRATFENPPQYSVGVKHVFVNGVRVLEDGELHRRYAGRALWGPGMGQRDNVVVGSV